MANKPTCSSGGLGLAGPIRSMICGHELGQCGVVGCLRCLSAEPVEVFQVAMYGPAVLFAAVVYLHREQEETAADSLSRNQISGRVASMPVNRFAAWLPSPELVQDLLRWQLQMALRRCSTSGPRTRQRQPLG